MAGQGPKKRGSFGIGFSVGECKTELDAYRQMACQAFILALDDIKAWKAPTTVHNGLEYSIAGCQLCAAAAELVNQLPNLLKFAPDKDPVMFDRLKQMLRHLVRLCGHKRRKEILEITQMIDDREKYLVYGEYHSQFYENLLICIYGTWRTYKDNLRKYYNQLSKDEMNGASAKHFLESNLANIYTGGILDFDALEQRLKEVIDSELEQERKEEREKDYGTEMLMEVDYGTEDTDRRLRRILVRKIAKGPAASLLRCKGKRDREDVKAAVRPVPQVSIRSGNL